MPRPVRIALLAAGLLAGCAVVCEDEESNCQGTCVLFGGNNVNACGEGDGCISCPDLHLPHAGPACVGRTPQNRGVCGIACARNYGDCNNDPADGCETPLDRDLANCGRCGAVCHGTCTAAGCIETLAAAEGQPSGLVADGPRVYWASRAGGQVRIRASADPTATPQTVAVVDAADGLPATMAMQGGELILATGGLAQADGGSGAILRVPLDGGAVTTIADGLDGPARVAVDGRDLYWTDWGAGEILRQADGGPVQVILSSRSHPRDVAVDAGTVYWLEERTDAGPGAIFSAAAAGGDPQPLSSPLDDPSALVVNFDGVYWSVDAAGLFRVRKWATFSQVQVAASGLPPWRVTSAVDGREVNLFWADSTLHAIRTPFDACPLVSGESDPGWIAIGFNPDPVYRNFLTFAGLPVFWADGPRVRRLTTTNTHNWGDWCQ